MFQSCSSHRIAVVVFMAGLAACTQAADVQSLGAHFRPDVPVPEVARFWSDKPREGPGANTGTLGLGGSLHLFVRNDGDAAVAMQDLILDGYSLKKVLAYSDQRKDRRPASIYFAQLPPEDIKKLGVIGEPVWWKCDPPVIGPHGVAQVVVRLRSEPKVPQVSLELRLASGPVSATVLVRSDQPRIEGISYSADHRQIYGYFRSPGHPGRAPQKLLLDGEDVTSSASIVSDSAIELVPVVVKLTGALAQGALHCLQGVYDDGTAASGAVRVMGSEFGYGVWGGMPGEESDAEGARTYVRDLIAHNVNLQMPQVGSAMLGAFYNSSEGQEFSEKAGLRFVTNNPGKWKVREPFGYFLKDEPDWADTRMKGLPPGHQVGSIAQYIVDSAYEMRNADPVTPNLLNVNLGYKPLHWYTYGQLPDIFASDPYYQVRIWETYADRAAHRELYAKAEWIYGVAAVAEVAGAPNPLHIILYGCRRGEGKMEDEPEDAPAKRRHSTMHRWATPVEKRLEAHYAIAGGAKGLSYWWFTPGAKSNGLGSKDPQARALWREVGLIGAEMRTAGPVLLTSCPATLSLKASAGVFAKTLLAGTDTLVLVVANDQHRNTDKGTDIRPVGNAHVDISLPKWIKPQAVFEVNPGGLQDVRATPSGRMLRVPLETLDATRLVVITGDAGLRGRLASLYQSKFAANVAKLQAGE